MYGLVKRDISSNSNRLLYKSNIITDLIDTAIMEAGNELYKLRRDHDFMTIHYNGDLAVARVDIEVCNWTSVCTLLTAYDAGSYFDGDYEVLVDFVIEKL